MVNYSSDNLLDDPMFDDVNSRAKERNRRMAATGWIITGISVAISIPSIIMFFKNKTKVEQIHSAQ